MKICLKELRETCVCLKIIQRKGYFKETRLEPLVKENTELVSIFVKSIQAASSLEFPPETVTKITFNAADFCPYYDLPYLHFLTRFL
ncbi:MAG: four helix bundle protein [Saprospiraceae bacterium]|nr:four helix bundle protein [Saprospiraceae bacterium]